MHLSRLGYEEHAGTKRAWRLLPFQIGRTTLLVGQNATGKSRTISVVTSLARTLRDGVTADGSFDASFDGDRLRYELEVKSGAVQRELLQQRVAGSDPAETEILLERDSEGGGWLKGSEVKRLKFGLTDRQVAAFTKRDAVQHPYLSSLHDWAQDFRLYQFGEPMGRTSLVVGLADGSAPDPDPRDPNAVAALFHSATKHVPGFVDAVISDMNAAGYDVSDVMLRKVDPEDYKSSAPLPGPLFTLAVQENGLKAPTSQIEMSQGMFRTLATIVHFNLCMHSTPNGTVAMDDIGEGLDFERSTNLINLLVEKANRSNIQLVMSTNDRYVMNAVPLEAWAVIVRDGSTCRVLNYQNARDKFDRFSETGLANVDFLRLQYWMDG